MDLSMLFEQSRCAARDANRLDETIINRLLLALAEEVDHCCQEILMANEIDLLKMDRSDPMYDRLLLTEERLHAIALDLRHVASLPSPLSRILNRTERPNGLIIEKVSVPLGVVGVIYEARPNVTLDVFALCLKSGNATILKGGSNAQASNNVLVGLIRRVLEEKKLNPNLVSIIPSDRAATLALLQAVGLVDVIIPRGSQSLIDYVRQTSRVPVIETGAGICHTYLDRSGDINKAKAIILNAKTRRVSVCNALDCLIIHKDRLTDLPDICRKLSEKNVEIFADALSFNSLKNQYPEHLLHPATEESFGTEFLSYRMSVKTALTLGEVFEHIARHSSKHSEAIISEDKESIARFQREVDAACVYVNASTAFTDGAQFGLGAEIGISTQKLHARGPMGLEELTSYKYMITGNGQIRE